MKLLDGEMVKSYHQAASKEAALEYVNKKLDDKTLGIASAVIRPMP